MNGYIGFDHKGRRYEIHAATLYAAHLKLMEMAKPPKSQKNLCSVTLVELDGVQVTTTITN